MKRINNGEKMIPLTEEESKSYKKQEAYHICEETFCMDKDDKDYINRKKVKDTVITQENLEELPIANAT